MFIEHSPKEFPRTRGHLTSKYIQSPERVFPPPQECFRWYLADGRLAWPDEVSRFGGDLVALVERCWDPLPEQRPTAEELMRALLQIALRLEAAKRVWVE